VACGKISHGLLSQPVEGARLDVLFELLIPVGSIKALEPGPELGTFLGRQLLERGFDGLDAGHGLRLILLSACRLQSHQPLASGIHVVAAPSKR
jgi:hypothetical protein